MKVLVVDDDPVMAEILVRRLKRSGFEVRFHLGPFGATAAVFEQQPEVAIVDISMPGLDGPHLVQLMRERPSLSRTSFVLYSSLDTSEIERLGKLCGADGWLSKSAGFHELLSLLEGLRASRDRVFGRSPAQRRPVA